MFDIFPLILIAVALFNALVFGAGAAGQHDIAALLNRGAVLPMFSGDAWRVTLGDGVLTLTLILLFVETVKATRTTTRDILNHALSMLTFAGALVEFLVLKGFGNSTFFFMTAMCLFDVVAGYTISIVAAKRDLTVTPPEYHQ
jgi:hypothetical protein